VKPRKPGKHFETFDMLKREGKLEGRESQGTTPLSNTEVGHYQIT
jgi:hypothetical protein